MRGGGPGVCRPRHLCYYHYQLVSQFTRAQIGFSWLCNLVSWVAGNPCKQPTIGQDEKMPTANTFALRHGWWV
jgi:hypothetical protein